MRIDNPFDKKLEAQARTMPDSVRDASIHVTDTLDIAWAAVQAVFERRATPEHALTLLPLLLTRIDAERQRLQDEAAAQMGDGTQPPAAPPAGKVGRS